MVNRHDDSFKIPIEALKDCFGRFFLMKDNRPYEDRIHFCAYLEQAYWFYIDSWVDNDKKLKNVSFPCFIQQIVDKIGVTVPGGGSVQTIVSEFTSFKHRVGTYGAILVNTALTKVLLVQSFSGQSWGFPKGKIEESEVSSVCAIREVKEEINYDISPYLNPELYLEMKIMEQTTRLYLIFGVPESTKFKTNTRKEIGEIRWFELRMLPAHRGDKKPLIHTNFTPNNFFVILPFVKRLREEVSLMQTRCLETFGVPLYDQDEFRLEFLKRYYPKVYKMRVDHEREARLEKQKDKALRDPNHPSEKTVKQQLAEDKLRNQKAKLTSVMTMLKNATSRSEALKKQALLQKNTTASDSPADLESRKFRFKTHLKARPDDGTSGSVTCGDAATPLHGSTIHQHACAAPLPGSTAPLLNSTAPLLNSIAPLPGSTAPLKHNPCNTGSTTANSMFPKFQIERSKTWDTAQLDYSDIMRAVEFTWRATYPNTTNTVSAVADRKRLGKENLHH